MRVPTSTLVFAIATCIPFGLAVRDTLGPAEQPDQADLLGELFRRSSPVDVDVVAAFPSDDDPRAPFVGRHDLDARIPLLWGSEPAALGSAFDGLAIGARAHADLETSLAWSSRTQAIGEQALAFVTYEMLGDQVGAFGITLRESCSIIGGALENHWGGGDVAGDRTYWVDHARQLRAVMVGSDVGCSVRHERFVPVRDWINQARHGVVPMMMLGQSRRALLERLEARLGLDPTAQAATPTVGWTDVGVGVGLGPTELTAAIAGDKVIAITAKIDVDVRTTDEVEVRLTELLGEPVEAAAEDALVRWAGKLPASLELAAGTQVVVTLGTPPR